MKDDGGAAFPSVVPEQGDYGPSGQIFGGMSLRDYFAGQVLAGILANPTAEYTRGPTTAAYAIADLMLLERNKQ